MDWRSVFYLLIEGFEGNPFSFVYNFQVLCVCVFCFWMCLLFSEWKYSCCGGQDLLYHAKEEDYHRFSVLWQKGDCKMVKVFSNYSFENTYILLRRGFDY